MSRRAWLSLGSNIDRAANLRAAVTALGERFGPLVLSPVYESEAVGFAGDPFYNMVVGLDSDLPVTELAAFLRALEQRRGRRRDGGRFAPRTLDLDLLLYGDAVLEEGGIRLPRAEILEYAFVLRPLADVAGEARHPVDGRRYRELWAAFDRPEQRLWPVDLDFD